jgi:putative alpha-1,2-mannosidase
VFGSPLLDHAEVDVGEGRVLTVTSRGNGPDCPYIQSVSWNGRPWTRSWISHAELTAGGTLIFEMGAVPNERFGAALADRPPSFGNAAS